ncbi:tail fiber assembly protein [Collimonas sp. NPDC087041]|uniref:tail fiber assembly protein n=1 Tax=Collimonas sp. NPDC087041 TaxID=3363960 RepID=UPI00382C36FF
MATGALKKQPATKDFPMQTTDPVLLKRVESNQASTVQPIPQIPSLESQFEPEPPDPFAYNDVRDVVRLPGGFLCSVKFVNQDGYLTFFACSDDIELHGRTIHQECAQGRWGSTPDYLPTHEEFLDAAQSRIAHELRRANGEVTKYQDRVDVGEASDEDITLVKAWKKYRVNLNRVPEQMHFPHPIVWPVAPADHVTTAIA